MLLQRFTERAPLAAGLLVLLVAAGCGGGAVVRDDAPESRREAGMTERSAGRASMPDAPSEALTLFEQATAVMAAGDSLDAELRFKEFVLLYPDYPGAWVNLAIIHANNENDAATREALDAALALNPNHPVA